MDTITGCIIPVYMEGIQIKHDTGIQGYNPTKSREKGCKQSGYIVGKQGRKAGKQGKNRIQASGKNGCTDTGRKAGKTGKKKPCRIFGRERTFSGLLIHYYIIQFGE